MESHSRKDVESACPRFCWPLDSMGFPWFSMVFRKSPGGLCLVSWGWLPDSSDNDQTLQHSWGFVNQLSLSNEEKQHQGAFHRKGLDS